MKLETETEVRPKNTSADAIGAAKDNEMKERLEL